MQESVQLGPFSVDGLIAEGGMGTVFEGSHRGTGVPVAIKVIREVDDERALRWFRREVRAHAGLLHPGIVYLFEYGTVGARAAEQLGGDVGEESPYVAMERADGGTVRDGMPVGSWGVLCRLLVQVLDALSFAHARGVVHRDLKPANLLRFRVDGEPGGGWRYKLADFGVAHALGGERDEELPDLERAPGTPYYMSPEQLRGRWRKYGPWTDLYTLGCITWHLVCGRPPFRGDSALDIALKHEREERPPLDPQISVPDALEDWIRRSMAIEPERRFRRAADALWALPRDVLAVEEPEALLPSELREVAVGRGEGDESGPSSDEDSPPPETRPSTDSTTLVTAASDDPGRADTLPAVPRDELRVDDEAEARGVVTGLHPPVPAEWRPRKMESPTTPLVDAGLGLFELREPPFVDRDAECDRIWRALRRVVDGAALACFFITGEPGTGKSRLAEWIGTRAHEVGAASVLRAVHTPGGGPSEGIRGALERALRTVKLGRDEVYDHLLEELPRLEGDGPEIRRWDARALTEYLRPTQEAGEGEGPSYRFSEVRQKRALIVRILYRLARRRPLVLWLDDLQWGAEALGVLEHLEEMEDEPPAMLVLGTVRSDLLGDEPRLADRFETLAAAESTEQLEIEPLSRKFQKELLDGVLPLEKELAERLAERTEGHPLFALQLIGHWVERGALEAGPDGFVVRGGREVELPSDIHALWEERIERLCREFPEAERGDVLRALELAAALGREVDADEFRAVVDRASIDRPLGLVGRLVEKGLAERTRNGWAFTHGMLVDTLERRMRAAGRREQNHRICARALEESGREEAGVRERVASHWVEAGEPERALEPLLDEIFVATKHDENERRRRLLEWRAELLDDLGVPEADPRRLAQNIERARMIGDRGDVEPVRDLLREVWDALPPEAYELQGRAAGLLSRVERYAGNLERSEEWGQRAFAAGRRAESAGVCMRSHRRLARIHIARGEMSRAERHARRAYELAVETGEKYGEVIGLILRAHVRLARGEPGGDIFERIRREARSGGFPLHEAQALNGLGEQARFDGRFGDARRYYREHLKKLRRELHRPTIESIGELNLAQVELCAGNFEAARKLLLSAERRLERVGGLESRRGMLRLIRMIHAAGTRDGERFSELASGLEEGWPEEWRLMKDHPWLLETAGEYALEAGWKASARAVWSLACELLEQLEDDAGVERLEGRLADLD